MAKANESPLYSAEITAIIGTPPRWLMRTGSGLLLMALLIATGLASTVSIPEQHTSSLSVKSASRPEYLRQNTANLRPVIPSGSKVSKGQIIARGTASYHTEFLRAPLAGLFLHTGGEDILQSPSDTIGLLVPLPVVYQFNGKIELGRVTELRESKVLQIHVLMDSRLNSTIVLNGQLKYVDPIVRMGQVSYIGNLDAPSSAILQKHAAIITSLKGTLVLTTVHKPILQRLFR